MLDPQVCTIITVRVRLSVQSAFHTFLLALDTDLFTFTMGRAHYSQLICVCKQGSICFNYQNLYKDLTFACMCVKHSFKVFPTDRTNIVPALQTLCTVDQNLAVQGLHCLKLIICYSFKWRSWFEWAKAQLFKVIHISSCFLRKLVAVCKC